MRVECLVAENANGRGPEGHPVYLLAAREDRPRLSGAGEVIFEEREVQDVVESADVGFAAAESLFRVE